MTVEFENLKEIPKLVALLEELIKLHQQGSIEKKWLNVEEAAYYLGYSKDKIYKLIQEEWLEGIHYHKPTGRVIIDKMAVDEWVKGSTSFKKKDLIDGLFAELKI